MGPYLEDTKDMRQQILDDEMYERFDAYYKEITKDATPKE